MWNQIIILEGVDLTSKEEFDSFLTAAAAKPLQFSEILHNLLTRKQIETNFGENPSLSFCFNWTFITPKGRKEVEICFGFIAHNQRTFF